jgi:hypothetical protein
MWRSICVPPNHDPKVSIFTPTHVVVDLPDFAARYHDPRWPSFEVDGGA